MKKKNGTRQGDLISPFYYYCSRTSFQKLAFCLKSKKFLKVCQYLISSSDTLDIPDDNTFLLNNEKFVTVRSAVLQCVNLKTDTIKLIGAIFSYDQSPENNKNYKNGKIIEIMENATANN